MIAHLFKKVIRCCIIKQFACWLARLLGHAFSGAKWRLTVLGHNVKTRGCGDKSRGNSLYFQPLFFLLFPFFFIFFLLI